MLQAATDRRNGILAALVAFITWGLAPLYFRTVGSIPPFQIVAHRILWSLLLLALALAFMRQRGRVTGIGAIRRQPRLIALLTLTAVLAGSNWLVFVWAIDAHRMVEASLGYFITPLVSILLGRLFLGERLRPLQAAAVGLACTGVAWRVWQLGHVPWVALFLAVSFGLYGLLRKRAPVEAIGGLFVEILLTAPLAIAYLAWLAVHGGLVWGQNAAADALLPLSGIITAVPLALFAFGARRLPLSTLGFLQYLSPSLGFLIAVLVFREPFDIAQLGSFALIWLALALYSADMLRAGRRAERAVRGDER